ncbi:hypothetical protein KSP39_PZI018657 [Platanthera zijinensis]|uniref:Uncharacterized protein n=1 Tax=Platanthera zijinensis TaxID=2320716 RepID=A0AAP0B4C3_9ASPA
MIPPAVKPTPRGHLNFGYGEGPADETSVPLLQWDKETNRVYISSLLSSWLEDDSSSGDAYNLAFGVYGQEDAVVYDEEATRVLIYESARSQFHSLELAHMVGRRCLRLDKSTQSLTKLIDEKEAARKLAQEEADELQKRAEAAEAALAQYLGGEDAATASRLGTEIATLQQEKQALQERVDALEAAVSAPPPSTSGCQLAHYSDHEIDVMMQKNAAGAAKYTFQTLQRANLIKDDGVQLLASEVNPSLQILQGPALNISPRPTSSARTNISHR